LSTAVAKPHALGGAPYTPQSAAVSHTGMHAVVPAKSMHSAMPYAQSLTFAHGIVQYPKRQNPLSQAASSSHGR
jgi:hypothetical protein